MSDALQIILSPAAQRLVDRLPVLPAQIQMRLMGSLQEQNERTVDYIRERYMSQRGPTTLGVISNRLRGSLRAAKPKVVGGAIWSAIGSNVKYMGYHEFGFDGVEQVKQFVRRILKRGPVPPGARISKKTGKIIEPKRSVRTVGQCIVHAHKRRVIYPGRAPIHRGIQDQLPNYGTAISNALLESFKSLTQG